MDSRSGSLMCGQRKGGKNVQYKDHKTGEKEEKTGHGSTENIDDLVWSSVCSDGHRVFKGIYAPGLPADLSLLCL